MLRPMFGLREQTSQPQTSSADKHKDPEGRERSPAEQAHNSRCCCAWQTLPRQEAMRQAPCQELLHVAAKPDVSRLCHAWHLLPIRSSREEPQLLKPAHHLVKPADLQR